MLNTLSTTNYVITRGVLISAHVIFQPNYFHVINFQALHFRHFDNSLAYTDALKAVMAESVSDGSSFFYVHVTAHVHATTSNSFLIGCIA